jgi:hypothetical protein
MDGVSDVGEMEFFRYLGTKKIFGKLAESYPSPREKEEVPLWMCVASNLSMRLPKMLSCLLQAILLEYPSPLLAWN